KRRIEIVQLLRMPKVCEAEIFGTQVVEILRCREKLEKLDDAGIPSGHVACQLLEYGRSSLAPSIGQGVGDLCALTEIGVRKNKETSGANQIADIGNNPLRAGFDELIVVRSVQVLLQHRNLLGDYGEQRFEGAALLLVIQFLQP